MEHEYQMALRQSSGVSSADEKEIPAVFQVNRPSFELPPQKLDKLQGVSAKPGRFKAA